MGTEVVAGARAFERLLELDSQRLVEGARLLAADPAFRETATTADRGSLGPALAKHGKRIGSAVMLLVDGDRRIVAGTLAGEIGKRFGQSKLLDRASAAQQATALVSFGGQLYQTRRRAAARTPASRLDRRRDHGSTMRWRRKCAA